MKLQDDNYISIPAKARMILDLKGNDLLVYGIIHGFTQDKNCWCECGLQYICDWIGVSDKSRVSIIIDRLVNAGAIEKEDFVVNNVKFCRYRVKPLPHSGKHYGGIVESTTNNIDNNNPSLLSHKDNICSPNNVDEKFEEFWNTYGKKVERAQAIRMWNRLTVAQKDEVLSRVKIYVASKPDVQYRLNPATYLNPANQRWLDDIIPNNGSQSGKPKSNVFFA